MKSVILAPGGCYYGEISFLKLVLIVWGECKKPHGGAWSAPLSFLLLSTNKMFFVWPTVLPLGRYHKKEIPNTLKVEWYTLPSQYTNPPPSGSGCSKPWRLI